MSGGVDSSVAAALLLREGYEVVGCFMRLGSPGEAAEGLRPDDGACSPVRIGHRGCCSVGDAADARLVAAQLDIPFYVCNFKRDFERIIDYFVDEYARGRTPNPCVRCNDWLKFGRLHEYARAIGADFVASGHYARIDRSRGRARLLRGVDARKDQSYVLFGASRDRLEEMLLPIGELEKPRVREIARELGLPVFDKPDSQEICFVPDDDYAGLVERRRPQVARAGKLVDRDGRVLGEHAGQHRFTIGQRRGVGVALGYPVYVVDKDPVTNRVIVGSEEDLLIESCTFSQSNWIEDEPESFWRSCVAKYRYNTPGVMAQVRRIDDGSDGFEVRFETPQRAVAPGQAVVLYDADEPDVVIGGGWIDAGIPAR